MSLINWLSQKQNAKPATSAAPEAVGAQADAVAPDSRPPGGRRAERVERREQLYAVVRHAMSSAGVLSSSYKFKVLSLDSRGASFLVMMDMVSQAAEDPERMSEIEALIASNAKNRFEIVVAAVYWRLSDYVAAGLSHRPAAPAKTSPVAMAALQAPVIAGQADGQAGAQPVALPVFKRPEPVGADEVLAFKNAFATQTKGAPLFASGEVQKSGKRSTAPMPPPEFADGQSGEDRISPLGPTQYGDLN